METLADRQAEEMITRTVQSDPTMEPQQVVESIRRSRLPTHMETMPKGNGEAVEVVFFKIDSEITDEELEKEYESRDLKSASAYDLVKVNTNDPGFANDNPNVTHWKDAQGRWYAVVFPTDTLQPVRICRNKARWISGWRFAGVRK